MFHIWSRYSCYRTLHGFQSVLLVVISVCAVVLSLVSLRSLSPIRDPLKSPGLIDGLSFKLGVQERSAVLIWELEDWTSSLRVFVFQIQRSDGSFYITEERSEKLLPTLFENETEARIRELLLASEKYLPPNPQRKVPLLVRLSSPAFSHPRKESVLSSVDAALWNRTLFDYRRESSVGLLLNEDKRALQWFAINLLRKSFLQSPLSFSETGIIFNLRDYDAELTFAVNSSAIKVYSAFPNLSLKIYKLRAYGHLINLITLKFPGLGLYSGRKNIYGLNEGYKKELSSPCVNPVADGTWDTGDGKPVRVRGLSPPEYEMVVERDGPFAGKRVNKPVANMEKCRQKAVDYLKDILFPRKNLTEVFKRTFKHLAGVRPLFMEGLLLEKCFEHGLTLPFRGGSVRFKHFLESLRYSCKSPNTEQPFACTDMTYLTAVLKELFGIKHGSYVLNSPRNMYRGMSGEWPLAAAFYVYQNGL